MVEISNWIASFLSPSECYVYQVLYVQTRKDEMVEISNWVAFFLAPRANGSSSSAVCTNPQRQNSGNLKFDSLLS
jgi:hypothetical protein